MKQYDTSLFKIFSLSLLLFASGLIKARAQEIGVDEAYQDFHQEFQQDYFSIGGLLQTVGDFQPKRMGAGHDGFSVANARFEVSGELDKFGYQLQAGFTGNPSILDANMYYRFSPGLTFKAGLFKAPFSGEELTSSADINFVNRATAVSVLAPARQIGFQLSGHTPNSILQYRAGMFNGNGISAQNDDDHFEYVGRVQTNFGIDEESATQLSWGVNASYQKYNTDIGNAENLESKELLLGSDLQLTRDALMLGGEVIYASYQNNSTTPTTDYNPYGYQVTAGYATGDYTQVLIRWDDFEGDDLGILANSRNIIVGLNVFPSDFSKIQLNYRVPTNYDESFKYSQVLVNLQISL